MHLNWKMFSLHKSKWQAKVNFVFVSNFPLDLGAPYMMFREGNGTSLQYSCLENPRDGGAWWAAIYGVAQSRTQLKQLSSSSIYDVNLLLHSLLIAFPSLFQHVDDFFLLIPRGSSYGLNVLSQNAYVVALILTVMEFGSGSFAA